MFIYNYEQCGYEAGTFKLDQKVYFTRDNIHRFHIPTKCEYCDSTGKVLIKGREFNCPNCNNKLQYREVIERVVDEPQKIRSVLTFKNSKGSWEIYATGSSGVGIMIHKDDDGTNRYFSSKEEAQKACDEYNEKNHIDFLKKKYFKEEKNNE